MGNLGILFRLLSLFQTIITIFTTNKCEKCPSSICCRDSNSRPLAHESPPITTRPGSRPKISILLANSVSLERGMWPPRSGRRRGCRHHSRGERPPSVQAIPQTRRQLHDRPLPRTVQIDTEVRESIPVSG